VKKTTASGAGKSAAKSAVKSPAKAEPAKAGTAPTALLSGKDSARGDKALGFDPKTAIAHLRKADAKLGKFIDRAGPFALQINPADSVFGMLAEAVVYQQLTAKAAATIFGRVCELLAPGSARPTPEQVLDRSEEELRGAGLSRAKALSLLDLARRAESGELPTLAAVRKMSDEDIVTTLSQVRGIGRWTAEMFLIFRLGRPDVLPLDDYGLRKGFTMVYRTKELPSKDELREAGAVWSPYRTVASWYLWRAVELDREGL